MGYDDQYESKLIRGDQDPLPWNLAEVISNYLAISDMILDIGCGTAFKLLQFSDSVRWSIVLFSCIVGGANFATNS